MPLLDRGSEWRKWDLHFHTPSSGKDYDYKEATSEELVKALVDNNVAVVAVTDHHIIDVDRIKEMRALGDGQLVILPGIEIRTDLGGKGGVHIIGIFPDDADLDELWQELSVPLDLTQKKVKQKGEERVYCEWRKAVETVHKLGGRVTIHSGPKANSIETITSVFPYLDAVKDDVVGAIDCFEVGRYEDVDVIREKVFPTLLKEYPIVSGSDNHDIRTYPCRCNCWIKADTTFAGLKQICYSPAERVALQDSSPKPKRSIFALTSLQFTNTNKFIDEARIPLNSGMIAIIGGRGAGKTAVVDTIVNCFSNNKRASCQDADDDPNSFIQRLESTNSDEQRWAEMGTKLEFAGQGPFEKTLFDDRFIEDAKIQYLAQGNIEQMCSDKSRLDEIIRNTIFGCQRIVETGRVAEYNEISKNKDEASRNIRELNSRIFELEQGTSPTVFAQQKARKALVVGKLRDIQSSIKTLQVTISPDDADKAKALQSEVDDLEKVSQQLQDILRLVSDLRVKFTGIPPFNRLIDLINEKLAGQQVSETTIPRFEYGPQETAIDKLEPLLTGRIAKLQTAIREKRNVIGQFSKSQASLAGLLSMQSEQLKEIELLDESFDRLVKLKKDLANAQEQRTANHKVLFVRALDLKMKYLEIIEEYTANQSEVLEGIEFSANIRFDTKRFLSGAESLDQRKVQPSEIEKLINDSRLAFLTSGSNEDYGEGLNRFTESIVRACEDWIQKRRSGLESMPVYDWIFGDYLFVESGVSLDGKPLDHLSIGQKGTVVLKILLAEGTETIVLDQPEDNLDNLFIFDKLVGAFLRTKKGRQVIITTHNANLVVNTDVEQVIVANYERDHISYSSGAIENPIIRASIIKLLEGGEQAFLARERKYELTSTP